MFQEDYLVEYNKRQRLNALPAYKRDLEETKLVIDRRIAVLNSNTITNVSISTNETTRIRKELLIPTILSSLVPNVETEEEKYGSRFSWADFYDTIMFNPEMKEIINHINKSVDVRIVFPIERRTGFVGKSITKKIQNVVVIEFVYSER